MTVKSELAPVVGHTPGPWEREPGGGRGAWIKGSDGEWAALACGFDHDTGEANARLIAAAPDLLEALQLAREWVESTALACGYVECVPENCPSKAAERDMALIDAALRKARGETTDA